MVTFLSQILAQMLSNKSRAPTDQHMHSIKQSILDLSGRRLIILRAFSFQVILERADFVQKCVALALQHFARLLENRLGRQGPYSFHRK